MKKVTLFLLVLIVTSLACLTTAEPMATYPPDPTEVISLHPKIADTATSRPVTEMAVTPAPVCAVVIAVKAVHLRIDANEHAQILTWLLSGDVVRVINTSNAAWWKIEHDGLTGYVRSMYLEKGDCENENP